VKDPKLIRKNTPQNPIGTYRYIRDLDGSLHFFHSDTLSPLPSNLASTIKGVLLFTIDKHITSPFRFYVAKRRLIQSYQLGDSLQIEKVFNFLIHCIGFSSKLLQYSLF